jgi:hypothetical protein
MWTKAFGEFSIKLSFFHGAIRGITGKRVSNIGHKLLVLERNGCLEIVVAK